MDRYIVEPTRFVIPPRRKAASPETITTNWDYGSRVLGLRPRPGMTPHMFRILETLI
jgi:hypothetical protein